MLKAKYSVVELKTLKWPSKYAIPSKRFRLFVAADVSDVASEAVTEFARVALRSGMVYFCAWGPGCERFHDIVDEVIVEDDVGQRLFAGPNEGDTIMTTWHHKESLREALWYFAMCTEPTSGFEGGSDYWLAMSLGKARWTATITQQLKTLKP